MGNFSRGLRSCRVAQRRCLTLPLHPLTLSASVYNDALLPAWLCRMFINEAVHQS